MTAGGPGIKTETISMHIFREGFIVFHMGYAATLTIVLFVVVNIFAVMFFYATSERKRRR
jgi:ABC-type sugar transport system permease subunit